MNIYDEEIKNPFLGCEKSFSEMTYLENQRFFSKLSTFADHIYENGYLKNNYNAVYKRIYAGRYKFRDSKTMSGIPSFRQLSKYWWTELRTISFEFQLEIINMMYSVEAFAQVESKYNSKEMTKERLMMVDLKRESEIYLYKSVIQERLGVEAADKFERMIYTMLN